MNTDMPQDQQFIKQYQKHLKGPSNNLIMHLATTLPL